MDNLLPPEVSVPESILQPLLIASKSFTLDTALEDLIQIAKTDDGRADLASKNILAVVLQLCQILSYPSSGQSLLLSLKLLRNLCAGELSNQNSFVEQNGVAIVSTVFNSIRNVSCTDYGIIRMGVQLLGNVSLAGEEHQRAIWHQFFPQEFLEIARLRSKDTCDPLCMVICTCLEGNRVLGFELGTDNGLPILVEIIRTVAAAGFEGDWLKLLLSITCLEVPFFATLFSKLPINASGDSSDPSSPVDIYTQEQSFLMSILSEILNEQIGEITISSSFALDVLEIFKSVSGVVSFDSRANSGLPTGTREVDMLGYSLIILRDICACDGLGGFKEGSVDVVDSLLSSGLLELVLDLLRDLEPPTTIRKAMKLSENQDGTTSYSGKLCPYKGFRRDIVAVIGNCAYRRNHVQEAIREKNGIFLILQQCVTDEENPFLREWGVWTVRNLLEGNVENQRLVSELEVQGPVDTPEIAELGLRVEVDHRTQRAKLVNIC